MFEIEGFLRRRHTRQWQQSLLDVGRVNVGFASWLAGPVVASSALGQLFTCLALLSIVAVPHVQSEEALADVEKAVRAKFSAPSVELAVESVERSEIPGVYRVELTDGPVVYSSADGSFFVVGDLYAVESDGLVNVAELRRSEARKEVLAAVPKTDQIVFTPDGGTKSFITVFTDVSCFYCQKLHKEVPELNKRGIEVRYLAYPREGLGSKGFRQLASAWCASDQQSTLTRLKNREDLDENVCPGNPVADQFALGQQLGVRGTPAIVLPGGEMIPGYKSADELLTLLLP
ncbi:MAG: DsbC family protein [Pseudomonadota bacterium]